MVRVVWSGVDTWEESFQGDLEVKILKRLGEAKEKAQRKDLPTAVELASRTLFVQPSGSRPWRYVLRDEEMLLRMVTGSTAPQLSGRLRPLGLVSRGQKEMQEELGRFAADLGLASIGVSRADIAVDFQGWSPTVKEMQNIVCNASWRPILPSVEKPETFNFGKGDLMVRVYNKTKEIAKSKKEWMRKVWATSPGYNPEEPVWRFEVQLRRPELKRLGCEYAEVLLENLPGVLGFALDWCNLRVPTGENQSRWGEDPRWSELREAVCEGKALKRAKVEHHLAGYKRSIKMVFSYSLTVCAWLGIFDLETFFDLLRKWVRDYSDETGKDFQTLVAEKAQKLISHA